MGKTNLSFWQLWNMNFGFLGIQYSFGLQQTAVSPIYVMLGADPDSLPILNLAGPMTGLLIQPLIGALSDRTWSPKYGRRKPYFLIGAIMCSLALLLFPFSSSLWMAAGLLWILDAGNNTAMEPYRAFVADVLPLNQQRRGFMIQSCFTGFGITLANVCMYFLQKSKWLSGSSANGLPYWVYVAFFVGAFTSISTVLWAMFKTKENPPSDEELAEMRAEKRHFFSPFIDIFSSIKEMPKSLWKLGLVYLFQWYGLFCYWQFASISVAKNIYNTTDLKSEAYESAVSLTGLINGIYNIVTFIVALFLMRILAKNRANKVHALCLGLAAVGLSCFAFTTNTYLLFICIIGLGIAWASIMGVPYLMVIDDIPKNKYGIYMGIINMMIVIPMLIQTVTFGPIYKNLLGQNANFAVLFAGILLGLAGVLSWWLFRKKKVSKIEAEVTSN